MFTSEYIGKPLKEIIPKIKDNTIIKVGSGSNFFYAYYKNELTIKRIEQEGKLLYLSYGRYKDNAIHSLEIQPQVCEREEEQLLKLCKGKRGKVYYQKLEKLHKSQASRKIRLEKMIANYTKLIDNWQPFLNRKVRDIYLSDIEYEPNTLIIIVSGKEMGKYTNIDEYAYLNQVYINDTDRHYPVERLVNWYARTKKEEE